MLTPSGQTNLVVISECTSYLERLSTYCLLVIAYSRFKIHTDLIFSGLLMFSFLDGEILWCSDTVILVAVTAESISVF